MAVTVKSITLWRRETENRAGALAEALEPFAAARTDLQILMAYRYPGADAAKAAIEIYPVVGKKATAAARAAGLEPTSIPALLMQGKNRAGRAHAAAGAIAGAGINLSFLMAQVAGKRFSAVLGFETEADAKRAAGLVKKALASKKKK
jgi:prephenate dehydratase